MVSDDEAPRWPTLLSDQGKVLRFRRLQKSRGNFEITDRLVNLRSQMRIGPIVKSNDNLAGF